MTTNTPTITRRLAQAICTAGILSLAACGESGDAPDSAVSSVSADGRCPHEIKAESCPFCNPEMVEAQGFCGEHGFPEALCSKCRPFLNVAFRAQDDWCEEHTLPQSQCLECDPSLADNIIPGAHGVDLPTDSHDDHDHDHAEDDGG